MEIVAFQMLTLRQPDRRVAAFATVFPADHLLSMCHGAQRQWPQCEVPRRPVLSRSHDPLARRIRDPSAATISRRAANCGERPERAPVPTRVQGRDPCDCTNFPDSEVPHNIASPKFPASPTVVRVPSLTSPSDPTGTMTILLSTLRGRSSRSTVWRSCPLGQAESARQQCR